MRGFKFPLVEFTSSCCLPLRDLTKIYKGMAVMVMTKVITF